jgi:hypothetical protein
MSAPRDNVVSINNGAASLPPLLRDLLKLVTEHCEPRLNKLFDQTDDRFFELAERAENNARQEQYFEAMRLIRLQQQPIIEQFSAALELALGEALNDSAVKQEESGSLSALSLIQHDELETQVAIAGMASRALSQSPVQLRALNQRLDTQVKRDIKDEQVNPLAPRTLSQAFVDACQTLEIEISMKLILYKLFEKQVLVDLDDLYESCNKRLVDKGVLPELKMSSPRKQQAAPAPSSPAAGGVNPTEGAVPLVLDEATLAQNQRVFTGMQSLLAQQQQTLLGSELLSTARHFLPGLAPELPQQEVLSLLAALQQQNQAQVLNQPIDVHAQLKALLESQQGKADHSLGQNDFDSINLIAMLFQYILDDENLAAPMKALIARLQIPMLKVSMLDQAFFGTGEHPARLLLNAIARAGLGWSPDAQGSDKLLGKIQSIVDKLLQNFETDIGVFAELLSDFQSFTDAEEKKAQLLESRVLNAEQGREKARQSREFVNEFIVKALEGKDAPEALQTVLFEGWANALFIIYLKEGDDSERWREAADVMQALIESVCEGTDPAALLKNVPPLLKKLREGLLQIGFDSFRLNEMFTDLEAVHLKRIRGMLDKGKKKAEESEAEKPENSADTRQPKPAAPKAIVTSIGKARQEEEDDESDVPQMDAESDVYRRAKSLQPGTWVEVRQAEGKRFRAKLADISAVSGRYLFVNRAGMKVLDCSLNKLAWELQEKRIGLLDDGALFDRALQNVIGNLRHSRAGAR